MTGTGMTGTIGSVVILDRSEEIQGSGCSGGRNSNGWMHIDRIYLES